ncbi:hypothetical protein C8J28_1279 [Cereibacter azotoformans]|uniref:Uncharacterized protein n=1 Tax=Cereibacter azotoformans TaxID=43057 RepID=A0A2T5JSJ7_9RHOB|nr:hypothetical protein C8J28_1279 [Cereibacter azotoformans]
MPRRTTPRAASTSSSPLCRRIASNAGLEEPLPDETQATLTGLMVRLILDHADGAHGPRKEEGHAA